MGLVVELMLNCIADLNVKSNAKLAMFQLSALKVAHGLHFQANPVLPSCLVEALFEQVTHYSDENSDNLAGCICTGSDPVQATCP